MEAPRVSREARMAGRVRQFAWRITTVAVVCAVCATVLVRVTAPRGSAAELMEIDGITLDSNAVRTLGLSTGDDAQAKAREVYDLSHDSSKQINNVLVKHEKGNLDGIPLDANAMKALGTSAPEVRAAGGGSPPQSKRPKGISMAQGFMNDGKRDLDKHHWTRAVEMFNRAERVWKGEGSANWRFAQTLKKDVLRAHKVNKSIDSSAVGSSSTPLGHHRLQVQKAMRQLSTGHAFRSLYGLMRSQKKRVGPKGPSAPYSQSMGAVPLELHSASEAALKGLPQQLRSQVQAAKVRLARRGRMQLLHEEAARKQALVQTALTETQAEAISNSNRGHLHQWLVQRAQLYNNPEPAEEESPPKVTASDLAQHRFEEMAAQAHRRVEKEGNLQQRAVQAQQNNMDTMYQRQLAWQQQRQYTADRWGASNETPLQQAGPHRDDRNHAAAGPPLALSQEAPASYQSLVQGNPLSPQRLAAAGEQVGGDAAAQQAARLGASAAARAQQLEQQGVAESPLVQAPPDGLLDGEASQLYAATGSEEGGNSPYQIAERGVTGSSSVPVINLNLPAGQKVPPGQYRMDGHMVLDMNGHWDFDGQLRPT